MCVCSFGLVHMTKWVKTETIENIYTIDNNGVPVENKMHRLTPNDIHALTRKLEVYRSRVILQPKKKPYKRLAEKEHTSNNIHSLTQTFIELEIPNSRIEWKWKMEMALFVDIRLEKYGFY